MHPPSLYWPSALSIRFEQRRGYCWSVRVPGFSRSIGTEWVWLVCLYCVFGQLILSRQDTAFLLLSKWTALLCHPLTCHLRCAPTRPSFPGAPVTLCIALSYQSGPFNWPVPGPLVCPTCCLDTQFFLFRSQLKCCFLREAF